MRIHLASLMWVALLTGACNLFGTIAETPTDAGDQSGPTDASSDGGTHDVANDGTPGSDAVSTDGSPPGGVARLSL